MKMIRNMFLLLTIFFIAACATTNDGIEPKLYSLDLKNINKITITEVGVKSVAGKDLNISCENFTLTQENINEYFNIAKRVVKNDYRHMLDWSPCYVKGDIFLDNGDVGKWGIHQYRGGTINFDNDKTIYMYCPKCKAKTFDNTEYLSNEKTKSGGKRNPTFP